MPSLLSFLNPTQAFPAPIKGGSVSNNQKFFFYCNYPEKVVNSSRADGGYSKYLASETVTGEGHVYSWHHNITGMTVKHAMLVVNDSLTNTLSVDVINQGTTSCTLSVANDLSGWASYLSQKLSQTFTVLPGKFICLFEHTVNSDCCSGIIGHIKITGGSARLQDVFYSAAPTIVPSSLAPKYDNYDDNRVRGLSTAGYVFTLTTPLINAYGNTHTEMAVIGKPSEGSFNDADMSTIAGKRLIGCYGQIMNFKMQVGNNSGVAKKLRIGMASRGGVGYYLAGFTSDATFTNAHTIYTKPTPSTPHEYVDIIETDTINPGYSQTINFFTVITGGSTAPYALSVRTC